MNNDHSEIFGLQLQIKVKKQLFDEAIRGDKEFAEVKKMYLELKDLEKQLEQYLDKSQKQFN